MRTHNAFRVLTAMMLGLFAALGAVSAASPVSHAQQLPTPSPNVSVFATGLTSPRGLKFGPDGNLYVAEGGPGGTTTTVGQCTQVPDVGPYMGSPTGGRISRISPTGTRTTVSDTFPSDVTNADSGSATSGVADVAFVNNTLYALISGGGCSHGVPSIPNGVARVNADGTWSEVANLSAFLMANPVFRPNAGDFEPDGTWYSMINVNGMLYAVEPNHGELDQIDPTTGAVTRIADISASLGHIVPTALAYYNGNFYVGNLNTFPVTPGSSQILQITPSGVITTVATGLTTVVGLAFDSAGQMYALEMSNVPNGPAPGTGDIVRVIPGGGLQPVASNLTFPTGMTFGPDGQLYVSEMGFGFPAGAGQVVRVSIPNGPPALQCSSNGSVSTGGTTISGTSCTVVTSAVAAAFPGTSASAVTCGIVTSYTAPTGTLAGNLTVNGMVIPIPASAATSSLAVGVNVRAAFLIPGGQLVSIAPNPCGGGAH